MVKLGKINIYFTQCPQITDAGILFLPKSLRTLNIKNSTITENCLVNLPNLEILNVFGCPNITPNVANTYKNITKLTLFNKITDKY